MFHAIVRGARLRRLLPVLTAAALLLPARSALADADLAARLEAHVKHLSAEIGERNVEQHERLKQAADYLTEQFKQAGYQVHPQEFEAKGVECSNVVAVDPTDDTSHGVVVFGAHYDSADDDEPNPGADDDASGVAVMLELARLLHDHPTPMAIKFVAFANEEMPWNGTDAMGSLVYAKQAKAEGERLQVCINLDMVGCFTAADRYAVVGADEGSSALADEVEKLIGAAGLMPTKRVGAKDPALHDTDSTSFWEEGFKSVFLSSPGFWLSDNYHKPTDTYEKLSYPDMALMVRSLVAVAEKLEPAAKD